MAANLFCSKKGTILLLITSVAFLISVILFFTYISPENLSLGGVSYEVLSIYSRADEAMGFIDRAAEISAMAVEDRMLSGKDISARLYDNSEYFIMNFRSEFDKYLKSFNSIFLQNISEDDYSFYIEGRYLYGISKKPAFFTSEYVNYSVLPNFKVEVIFP